MKKEKSTKPPISWVSASFIIGIHLIALLGFFTFNWSALTLCIFLYWITGGLGITLGFHRLLTHRSFQVPKWLEYFLALCGTLALQSGPITWVATHRHHHKTSDTYLDPHSPTKGFWWSHMEWTLRDVWFMPKLEYSTLISDLSNDKFYQFLNKNVLLPSFILSTLLYLLGGWSFVIWGIFVRLVLTWHCTWLVNSAAHIWGYRTYDTDDNSKNNWWVALLTFGEGWHNNHHKFQSSARHGIKWWEFDLTYLTISFLGLFKIAKSIKIIKPNY